MIFQRTQTSTARGHLSDMEGTGTGEKPQANSILSRSIMEKQYLDEDEFEDEGEFRGEEEFEGQEEFEDKDVWYLDPGDDGEEELLLEDYDDFEVAYLMHSNQNTDVISTRGKYHLSVWRVTVTYFADGFWKSILLNKEKY